MINIATLTYLLNKRNTALSIEYGIVYSDDCATIAI